MIGIVPSGDLCDRPLLDRRSPADAALVAHSLAVLLVTRRLVARASTAQVRRTLHRVTPRLLAPIRRRRRDASEIASAIDLAGRRMPGEVTCLHRALVAEALLRRHHLPAELHIGVRRDESIGHSVRGHAWVRSDAVVIGDATDLAEFGDRTLAGPVI